MAYATEPPCAEDGDIYWLYNVKYYPKPVMFEYNTCKGWVKLVALNGHLLKRTYNIDYHPNKEKHVILNKVIIPDIPVEPLRPKDMVSGWYLLHNDNVAGNTPSTWYYDENRDTWMDAQYNVTDTASRLGELGYTLYKPQRR